MVQEIDEMRLVSAAKRGNRDAFGELIARHMKAVLNVARRITRNREDAEDAVQESFRSALVHVASFDGRSRFSTWLTRIAIDASLMKLRKNRGIREVSLEEPPALGEAAPHHETKDAAPNPEEAYAADELRRILRETVVELRPRLRDTVDHQLREKSLQETACERQENGLPHITYISGALENIYPEHKSIRPQVCRILEGGTNAFLKRERRYSLMD